MTITSCSDESQLAIARAEGADLLGHIISRAARLISRTRHVRRNVNQPARRADGGTLGRRGRPGSRQRLSAIEKGHKEMPTLVAALRVRDHQLGLVKKAERIAESSTEPPLNFNRRRCDPS